MADLKKVAAMAKAHEHKATYFKNCQKQPQRQRQQPTFEES